MAGKGAEIVFKYFPDLTEEQKTKFRRLDALYRHWNEKINVISRKDIDNLYEHHVLHSLAIAKYVQFRPGSTVLDLGTGGGFPGIPLAILFPEADFLLVDSRSKKLVVVDTLIQELGLQNVQSQHIRAESLKASFHFVVSRAVADLGTLVGWSQRLISDKSINALPNGLISLKGGNIKKEVNTVAKNHFVETEELKDYFQEEYFEEKKLVYVQV